MPFMQILTPVHLPLPWENIEELGLPKSPSKDEKGSCCFVRPVLKPLEASSQAGTFSRLAKESLRLRLCVAGLPSWRSIFGQNLSHFELQV